MKRRFWFICLALSMGPGAAHAAEWQIVLLKPPGCTVCVYVEEILKRGAQLREATLDDGAGGQVTASIQRRNSSELTAQEWQELRALPAFDEPAWKQRAAARSAQVLLKRDGVIASAGDIADSADLRAARFPAAVTMPDTNGDLMTVFNARSAHSADLLRRSWNLDWFYRLALNPTLLQSRSTASWISGSDETLMPPLASANVLLMSTASGAADNEIFNALRIEEIGDVLAQSLSMGPPRLRIFYGGDNAHSANALEVRNGRIGLVKRNVAGATPFSPEAVSSIFRSIRATPGSRNLLVLIGHGNPDGAGMWGSPMPLSPATLRMLHEHGGGDDVLVSGNCFGGVMARAMSCGFFGARPDIIATGCQADAAQVAESRDYLHMFFTSLTAAGRTMADADRDGVITFAEAHWYASTEGDPRNVTFTSVDALADEWFEAQPQGTPRTLSAGAILELAADAPPAEARALRSLLAGHPADVPISLDDLAGQAARWNPGSGVPRTLVAQLTRRQLFRKSGHNPADRTRLLSCENRSIAAFLEP
jgi:hypothetical protein